MATSDEINIKNLPAFSGIKPFEQLAVSLRAEGKTNEQIANTINAEYDLAYKMKGVSEWFWAGGRLEQAYLEYLEWYADQSVVRAKLKIKTISEKAASTLEELMSNKFDGRVRQQAAKTVLGKYIPDRQVIVDPGRADELPSALNEKGDELMGGQLNNSEDLEAKEEGNDGPKPVDNSPESPEAGEQPGPGSS